MPVSVTWKMETKSYISRTLVGNEIFSHGEMKLKTIKNSKFWLFTWRIIVNKPIAPVFWGIFSGRISLIAYSCLISQKLDTYNIVRKKCVAKIDCKEKHKTNVGEIVIELFIIFIHIANNAWYGLHWQELLIVTKKTCEAYVNECMTVADTRWMALPVKISFGMCISFNIWFIYNMFWEAFFLFCDTLHFIHNWLHFVTPLFAKQPYYVCCRFDDLFAR